MGGPATQAEALVQIALLAGIWATLVIDAWRHR